MNLNPRTRDQLKRKECPTWKLVYLNSGLVDLCNLELQTERDNS
jgi:hypothetical protein